MIYAFEDLELDTRTVELRRGGEIVHVEPQVFGVLAHLIANRDRVVSKIELLDEVWPDRFVSESALTSRLQAARKACGDNGRDQRVIRTKHGRGYRFVADVIEHDDSERSSRGEGPPRWAHWSVNEGLATGGSVARQPELDTIDRALASATSGRGRMLLVAGEAGMGKTTLVESTLERVDPVTGLKVVRAQCRAHRRQPEPYVSLLDGLSRLGREHGEAVVDVLEQVAPMWLQQLPSLLDPDRLATIGYRVLGGTHERMLREGVDLLERLADTAPLIVVMEDLHWADQPTIELIEWLADRVGQCAVLALGTYRPGEGADGHTDAAVTQLVAGRLAERIQLGPLDSESVERMIADRLEADGVDDELVRVVTTRTGGNPLFVNEQVDSWKRDGEIQVTEGRVVATVDWRDLDRSVPEGVRQLIERSLERLQHDEVEVLEAGAVVGREFPAFAVAAALGQPIDAIEERLGALARRGSFVTGVGDDVWADGTASTVFRLSHDLHHQVLYDRIAASRKAKIHQRVGERLEAAWCGRTDEHGAALLRHFESSGDVQRTVRYLHRSGELAVERSAYVEAVEPLEHALELLGELPESDEHRHQELNIRATLGPALVATLGWREPEVQANYEQALRLAEAMHASPERFIVRYGLASVHELRGEYNRSAELLREQVIDGPELGVETHELMACSAFHQGAYERSLDHASTAVDLWDPETHSPYLARYGEHPGVSCSTWAALSAWYLGRPGLSMEMAEKALEWAAENSYASTAASVQIAFLHQYRDEPDRCRYWAEETVQLADAQGFAFRAAQGQILVGWCTAAEGDPDTGIRELSEGLTRYRDTGARMDEPYYLGLLADAELRAGRPDDALTHLDEAAEILLDTTRSFFYEPELDRLRAVALLARGPETERETAERLLDRAAATAASHSATPLAIRIATTRLELGFAGDPDDERSALGPLLDIYDDQPGLPDVVRARAQLAAVAPRT